MEFRKILCSHFYFDEKKYSYELLTINECYEQFVKDLKLSVNVVQRELHRSLWNVYNHDRDLQFQLFAYCMLFWKDTRIYQKKMYPYSK